jgi:predicted phosphodiesterase
LKIVCISDTHLMHLRHKIKVPPGDVLIHAGDATFQGSRSEIRAFSSWLSGLPHKHKVFVAGNHDWGFQINREDAINLLPKRCHYLEDSGVEIDGIKFWGSPWQPEFMGWAFNLPRGEPLRAHWDLIPDDVDVLVTHSPPYGIGDWVDRGEKVGCEEMRAAVARVQPRLHVFGHIHGQHGRYDTDKTIFINASTCDESYAPVNEAIVVEVSRSDCVSNTPCPPQ